MPRNIPDCADRPLIFSTLNRFPMRILPFFAALFLLTFSACKVSNSNKLELMATELCDCMKPLMEINAKAEKLANEGLTEEVKEIFNQLQQEFEKAESCALNVEKKYGPVAESDEQLAQEALTKVCPETANLLMELSE